jgi:hypothetical protein
MSTRKHALSTAEASAVLEPVLGTITERGYDSAKTLPPVEARRVETSSGTSDLTIYRDTEGDGSVRVVAQLSVDHGRFLFFFRQSQCFAEGLQFSSSAPPRRLRGDELYEFT